MLCLHFIYWKSIKRALCWYFIHLQQHFSQTSHWTGQFEMFYLLQRHLGGHICSSTSIWSSFSKVIYQNCWLGSYVFLMRSWFILRPHAGIKGMITDTMDDELSIIWSSCPPSLLTRKQQSWRASGLRLFKELKSKGLDTFGPNIWSPLFCHTH